MGVLSWIGFALSIGSAYHQKRQMDKEKARREAERDKQRGQKFTVSGQAAPLPVIYGKQVTGGINVKQKVNDSYTSGSENFSTAFSTNFNNNSVSGSKKEFLAVQTALCHGGIEGVQHILVDDVDYRGFTKEIKANSAKFSHRFHIHNNGNTADAAASSNGFPTTNTFTNTAFATAFYRLNRKDPQYNGVPSTKYILKGRKIRKISYDGTNYTLNSNYEYSNNPAYCLLDYLLNAEFGRNLSTSQVDLPSFYNAASVCDTIVLTNATIGGSVNGVKPIFSYNQFAAFPTSNLGFHLAAQLYFDTANAQLYSMSLSGTAPNYTANYTSINSPSTDSIRLYECNITLNTEDTIRDNIEQILSTMGIADLIWSPSGKYKLVLDYPTSASATDTLIDSNHYFTEDDIIRETATIDWPSAQDRFTQVTVQFDNEAENFKPDSVTWPPTEAAANSVYQTYLSEDNNNPLTTSVSPSGITTKYHALAYAEQQVRKSRLIYTLDVTLSKKALTVEPGDLIKITSDNLGLDNGYVFRVESTEIREDFSVKIKCYFFDHTMLSWNVADDVAYTILPDIDFSIAAPTSLAFVPDNNQLYGTASGKLTWTAADDIAANEYLIEVKLSSENDTAYQELGSTSTTTFDVLGLKAGTYDFSVRSRSISNRLSNRAVVINRTLQLVASGTVAIIYADTANEATNTQSYTYSNQEFVAYHPHTGAAPTLPIRSSIDFVQFVGADGATGSAGTTGNSIFPIYADDASGTNPSFSSSGKTHVNFYSAASAPSLPVSGLTYVPLGVAGADGVRGAGWWRFVETNAARTISAYYGVSNQVNISASFLAATTYSAVNGDRFIIKDAAGTVEAYIYNGSAWVVQADFIDGDLMVAGTITSDKLSVTNLSAVAADMGTLTAGKLQSTDGKFKIDLTNKEILIVV